MKKEQKCKYCGGEVIKNVCIKCLMPQNTKKEDKMKEYTFEVEVKWTQTGVEAKTDEEAIDKLQNIFKEEFGFCPKKEEITILDRGE